MTDHDRLFKELLCTFFAEFAELFLPELYEHLDTSSFVFLDKEIFTDVTAGEALEVDLVVRAKLRQEESFILVHTETQSCPQALFGARMFRYFARLHERHHTPVYPVVLFSFDKPKSEQPCNYRLTLPGLEVLNFRYRVIQLNRLRWRSFLKHENPVAAALMSKMQVAPKERVEVKLDCLRMIANLGLNRAKSRLISGFVDSYLTLSKLEQNLVDTSIQSWDEPQRTRIMEITTSWERRGLEKGRIEGRVEGRLEGRAHEALKLVTILIERRFGAVDACVVDKLRNSTLESLEQLVTDILDFKSVDDVDGWLKRSR